MSEVIVKAQNRHIDCWDKADLLPMAAAMLGGTVWCSAGRHSTVTNNCVLADRYCLFCLLPLHKQVKKLWTKECKVVRSPHVLTVGKGNAQMKLGHGTKRHAKG